MITVTLAAQASSSADIVDTPAHRRFTTLCFSIPSTTTS